MVTVDGICGKTTIEKALTGVEGVQSGVWNVDTDLMTVTFDENAITLDMIKQKIADVGYDSDTHRAKDEVYNALHGCCQYDRPAKNTAESLENAESTVATFRVYGNCGMCKTTIEKSVKGVDGISSGVWERDTDQMTVVYDSKKNHAR